MDNHLVILGSCGAWPEPGRACSGFVVDHDGFRVVLDLGYGTLPRLLAYCESATADGIDAVVITHSHPDHMVDLHGLFRARWFGHQDPPPIPLYAPEGVMARLSTLEDDDDGPLRHVFDWHPLPASPYELGPFRLESIALPHFVPNAGVRLSADGLVLAYTGDTGPDPALEQLGRDADVYIVEATSRSQQPGVPPAPAGPRMHLSAREAGQVAAAAGAIRLVLTHFWPGNDRARSAAEASEVFGGEVLIAEEGRTVDLGLAR